MKKLQNAEVKKWMKGIEDDCSFFEERKQTAKAQKYEPPQLREMEDEIDRKMDEIMDEEMAKRLIKKLFGDGR